MILKEIKIDTWIGDKTNSYIVFDEESKQAMVIDPAGEIEKIEEMLEILGANIKYIYLTHCHGDHIAGVNELKNKKGGKVLIHRFDANGLNDSNINLCPYIGMEDIKLEADSIVDDKDMIHLGNLKLEIIHTPGHTKGGSSVYIEEQGCVFTGDTMFNGTWGRTDLPTSDRDEIFKSITKRLLTLPGNTMVYPGHGRATKIEDEKPIYLESKPKRW